MQGRDARKPASPGTRPDEAARIAQAVIERALAGDSACLRMCLERLVPPAKDLPLRVSLPGIRSESDVSDSLYAVYMALCAGEMLPSQATRVVGVLESYRKSVETEDLQRPDRRARASSSRQVRGEVRRSSYPATHHQQKRPRGMERVRAWKCYRSASRCGQLTSPETRVGSGIPASVTRLAG
jgi:hypothetical protein